MRNIILIILFQLSFLAYGQTDSIQLDSVKVQSKLIEKSDKLNQSSKLSELDYYRLLAEQAKKDN